MSDWLPERALTMLNFALKTRQKRLYCLHEHGKQHAKHARLQHERLCHRLLMGNGDRAWKRRSNLSISLDVVRYAFNNKAGNMLNNTQNLYRHHMNRLGFKETDAFTSSTCTAAKQHTYFYRIVKMVFRAIRCHAHRCSGAV